MSGAGLRASNQNHMDMLQTTSTPDLLAEMIMKCPDM